MPIFLDILLQIYLMWALQFNVLFISTPTFFNLVYSITLYVVYVNVIIPISYILRITKSLCELFVYLEKVSWF